MKKAKKSLVLFGSGGHAQVILDILEQTKMYRVLGLVDPFATVKKIGKYPVLKSIPAKVQLGIVAVGDNLKRSEIVRDTLKQQPKFRFVAAIHPTAVISPSAEIDEGSVVMAGAVVNPGTKIGRHCIINTRASLDHDCVLGDFASIGPGATLGGQVTVGDLSAIGLGAACIQLIKVGKQSFVGAGSVVVEDVHDLVLAYGNPCRERRRRRPDEPYYESTKR